MKINKFVWENEYFFLDFFQMNEDLFLYKESFSNIKKKELLKFNTNNVPDAILISFLLNNNKKINKNHFLYCIYFYVIPLLVKNKFFLKYFSIENSFSIKNLFQISFWDNYKYLSSSKKKSKNVFINNIGIKNSLKLLEIQKSTIK